MIIWRSCTEIIAQIRWFSLSKRLSGCKTLLECKQFLQCQLWSAGWRLNPASCLQSCRFLTTKLLLSSHTCEFRDVMNPTAPWIRLINAKHCIPLLESNIPMKCTDAKMCNASFFNVWTVFSNQWSSSVTKWQLWFSLLIWLFFKDSLSHYLQKDFNCVPLFLLPDCIRAPPKWGRHWDVPPHAWYISQ